MNVLLATYNGEHFLEAQLRSLLEQTHPLVRVLAHDDGSSDATPALLADWAARQPGKIDLLDGGPHLGACGNFAALLQRAEADYVMFCDQDDVWLPDKIARTLEKMRQAERRAGPAQPLLVHTDLAVVDESLRRLGYSYWHYQHLDVRRGSTLSRLLMQNVATGCAAMLNRALVARPRRSRRQAVLHDWWIALVAAAFGRIERLDEPTVLYRQHGGNQVGAVRWRVEHGAQKIGCLFDRNYLVEGLQASQRQATVFLELLGAELSPAQRQAVEAYAGLGRCGFFGRRWRLARYGFYRSGWLRNLALFAPFEGRQPSVPSPKNSAPRPGGGRWDGRRRLSLQFPPDAAGGRGDVLSPSAGDTSPGSAASPRAKPRRPENPRRRSSRRSAWRCSPPSGWRRSGRAARPAPPAPARPGRRGKGSCDDRDARRSSG